MDSGSRLGVRVDMQAENPMDYVKVDKLCTEITALFDELPINRCEFACAAVLARLCRTAAEGDVVKAHQLALMAVTLGFKYEKIDQQKADSEMRRPE